MQHTRSHQVLFLGALLLVLLVGAGVAQAQPYGAWLTTTGGHGYVQLPNSSSLDFSGGSFTFEAWVAASDSGGCSSFAGNDWHQSTWIGLCGTTLRSYLRGSGSQYSVGTVRPDEWTHIAVTFDATTGVRSHYVDGELAGSTVEPSGIAPSTGSWRIFSDANWEFTPSGAIDEVRFWNVARTQDEIRSTINQTIRSATTGLVAVYPLDGNATAAIGSAHGTTQGNGVYVTSAVGTGCTTDDTHLCVGDGGRFEINAKWITSSTNGDGHVVATSSTDSGIFWFFGSTNWEVMIKVLNACSLNNRYWVFAAGLTNVHYKLAVTDIHSGVTKQYLNYAGNPAPATTDTNAFATCP